MTENDIMELWGTYSYCTYLQTHPKNPKYVDQHGRLWGRNSGKPIWSNNSCKVGSLLFQINDAVHVTLLVPSYNTCLVLPLCERVPYESPTKVIPNILIWFSVFANPPTIIIPQGGSSRGRSGPETTPVFLWPQFLCHQWIRVHTICAGQGWPLLSRKFTSPASRSGYRRLRRPSHQEKPCQTSKPFTKTGFS